MLPISTASTSSALALHVVVSAAESSGGGGGGILGRVREGRGVVGVDGSDGSKGVDESGLGEATFAKFFLAFFLVLKGGRSLNSCW